MSAWLTRVLVCSSLSLSCLWISVLPGLGWYFLSHVREVFSYYLFKYFLGFFLFPCGSPIMWMIMCLMLSQRSLRLSSFFCCCFFILFSIFCSVVVISTILSSRSLIHPSASGILLWIPSNVLFISVYLFFSFSRSLVNISCVFSIVSLRSWIIFTIIILNYFFWKVAYLHFI